MKRRIALTLALALLTLTGLPHAARGQQQRKPAAFDTGVVTLGPNQILRITVSGQGGNDTITVNFRRMTYGQGACNDGACKLTLIDLDQFPVVTLGPGEAASFDIPNAGSGFRGLLLGNILTAAVTAQIIDAATGQVVAFTATAGGANPTGL